jgi:hypothetical protein
VTLPAAASCKVYRERVVFAMGSEERGEELEGGLTGPHLLPREGKQVRVTVVLDPEGEPVLELWVSDEVTVDDDEPALDRPKGKPFLRHAGKITETDPIDPRREGSRHKVHKVKMAAGGAYAIDLRSKDFDPYLRLEATDGKVLEEDDDGGGELNARIVFRPRAAGEYRVIVTSFNGGFGRYTLTVRGDQKAE